MKIDFLNSKIVSLQSKPQISKSSFQIWKDGHLYMEIKDEKEANRMYDVIRNLFNPRVLKLIEIITVEKLRRDNDEIFKWVKVYTIVYMIVYMFAKNLTKLNI